jgi:hypothetical protein
MGQSSLVVCTQSCFRVSSLPKRRHNAERSDYDPQRINTGGLGMAVLWVLVALLIILAIVGGAAVNNWLFLILVIAVVLALVGAF